MKLSPRSLKIILFLSVIVNLLLAYKVIKAKYFGYEPDLTFNRKDLFSHLKIDTGSIVFIGNSLTQQFELAELFQDTAIRNRGINGDNLTGIFSRLPAIIAAKPKKIFLEAGINDIIQGADHKTLLKNYRKIIVRLQQESPESKLHVESLLPVSPQGTFIRRTNVNNETIREVNKALQSFCASQNITFINLYSAFELSGEMNPKYCIVDGVHISGEGYVLLAKLLRPFVNE